MATEISRRSRRSLETGRGIDGANRRQAIRLAAGFVVARSATPAAGVPDMGAAAFGEVEVTYSAEPVEVGDYTATFTVAETENYTGLTKEIPFTISPAASWSVRVE